MQISVIVVTFNEETRLESCLQSLKRFEDVVVVDIGSTDRSTEIAQAMSLPVIRHPWVPIGEMVLPGLMPRMQNDWIMRVDPDEVVPSALIEDLLQLEVEQQYGVISVPYQYYFLNRRLDTTIWGGVRPVPRVIHRARVSVTSEVHRTLNCKPGYETFILPSRLGNAVQHYWVDGYRQLFAKHERYIRMEGESRHNHGYRFAWKSLVQVPWESFKYSFIECSGWRGGWSGWFLSTFIAFYEARAWLSLRRYETQKMLKPNQS